MAIHVPCPGCGVLLGLPDQVAGERARCPKCNHIFVVPSPAPPLAVDREDVGGKELRGVGTKLVEMRAPFATPNSDDVREGHFQQTLVATHDDGDKILDTADYFQKKAAAAARLLSGARDADVAAASARVLSVMTTAAGAGFDRLADALDREAALAHQKRTPLGEVRHNAYMLRFATEGHEFTVFPDGRAIIKGTTDTAVARSLYARYIGS